MAIIAKLPSFKEGLLVFTLLYGLYYIYWQLTVGASRRAVIKKHGCQPVRPNTEYNSFPNNALGFKAAFESIKAAKEHRYLETINSRFLRHGNTLKLRILMTDIITTIEPKNVQTMLALKFDDWKLPPRRKTIFETFGGRGIFTTDGPQWKHSRELVRPNFVRSQVGDLETFERHTRHLIAAIPKDGSTVDMQDLFFKLTTDSATEHLIGESTHSLVPSEGEEKFSQFAESFNRGVGVVAYTFRVSSLSQMYYLNGSQYKGDVKRCHDFVDSFVRKEFEKRKKRDLEKADAEEEGRYVFLKELVKLSDDPVEVRSELLNVLIAGRDTTASMLSDVWFVLARRPDIFVKLRAEVDELGGEKPTYQQLKDMKYLRYLMNESLRLYPVVFGNTRCAVRDTMLPLGGGPTGQSPLFIPEGQLVQFSMWAMHRREDYYGKDAAEFKPERWEKLKPSWEYLPFNGGPRICLGQQFALTEAGYTIVRLVQAFRGGVEKRENEPWTEELTLTCAIKQGVQVAMIPT